MNKKAVAEDYLNEIEIPNYIWGIEEFIKGDNLLIVGLDDHKIPLLLGREGKKVFGIDRVGETVNKANSLLSKEDSTVKGLVSLSTANFQSFSFNKNRYSTIVFSGAILNNINLKYCLKKGGELLEADGRIICLFPLLRKDIAKNHTSLTSFLEFNEGNIYPAEVQIIDEYLMVIYKEGLNQGNNIVDYSILNALETVFLHKEMQLNNDLVKSESELSDLKNKYALDISKKEEENRELKLMLADIRKEMYEQNEAMRKFGKNLIANLQDGKGNRTDTDKPNNKKELDAALKEITLLKKERIKIKEELLQAFDKEEKLLQMYKKLLLRYKSLSSSKLGKLTLYYWKLRKR